MCLSQIVGLDELYSRVLGINAILFYEIAKGNFSVCHSLFMIFIGLVDLGRSRGECFLVESTRHLARRCGRTSGLWSWRSL